MSEKMLEVCLNDYLGNVERKDGSALLKAIKALDDYILANLDRDVANKIESLAARQSSEAEIQGFENGFKYAIEFFGVASVA